MTHNLIILEGADRVGKSTLAAKLGQEFNYPVEHFGKPDQTIIQQDECYFYQYHHLHYVPQSRILDRSWLSRIFYTTLRDYEDIKLEDFYHLHTKLSYQYEIYYIFLDRPWNQQLESEHQKEIDNGLGYGTMEERKREHYTFRLINKLLKNTPLKTLSVSEFYDTFTP